MADYNVKTSAAGGGDGSSGNPYTLQEAFDAVTAGNRILIWDGTYSLSAPIDVDTQAGTETSPIQVIGVNSSGVEDGTRPILRAGSSIAACLRNGGTNIRFLIFRNIDFDGNSNATDAVSQAVTNSSDDWNFTNCIFRRATGDGYSLRCRVNFLRCEFHSNGSCGVEYFSSGGHANMALVSCSIHDNTSHGIYFNANGVVIVHCTIYDNGGDGIKTEGSADYINVLFCTIFGNSGDGIDLSTTVFYVKIVGNSIDSNGGYGMKFVALPSGLIDFNQTDNNTSGACDVTLISPNSVTGDPGFASETDGSEDFTPGNGGTLDAAGPSPMSNGDVDIGAVKAADPAGGGGGLLTHPGMAGGMRG